MRTLKYAILGLINRKGMTGYDIAKEFDSELANFWYARHSQIYPELKKLTEEGLVKFDVEISGDVLEKKVYNITPKGAEEFTQWLLQDEELEPTPKDKFRLRMYFSDNIPAEETKRLLEGQILKRKAKLDFLSSTLDAYEKAPETSSDRFGDYIVVVGAVMRERTNIEWLETCMEYFKTNSK